MGTVYSSLLFSGSLLSLPTVYPTVFLCGRGARWEGCHRLSLRLFIALGISCPCPQHPCALCSVVSRVPSVTLLSGVCVWLPWAAGEGTELCPLAWPFQHSQGSCLHVPVSCVTCAVPALPQQKSQVFVAGFGQQIAADLEYGVGLGLSCSPNISWVCTTCSALWDICLCSGVQCVG